MNEHLSSTSFISESFMSQKHYDISYDLREINRINFQITQHYIIFFRYNIKIK